MKTGCTEAYRDRTWLLLRISREDDDVAHAQNAGQLISEFLKNNEDLSKAGTQDVQENLAEVIEDQKNMN